ncbi:MAG: excinuclease ABC subunit UvrC [Spirochaetales bacterium]|nr:excinuclease ABC subunit UvrC [Spirochaetales bacterium]MCF7938262.1 excinuclease ABC subunit UvrC [Spirochaetales bacterium]
MNTKQGGVSARIEELKKILSDIPDRPGVYLFKSRSGTVIYVGKAKKLRTRLRSYFAKDVNIKTRMLVERAQDIDHIVTDTEYEALLLENNLIKRFLPRYNINLKDGKSYPVIRITAERWPRVFRTRRVIEDGSDYYGPYTQVHVLDTYLEIIERLYPLRKCRGPLKKREHPCLYYHIGRCGAPCAGRIDHNDYKKRVEAVRRLLSGDVERLKLELTTEMHREAQARRYERAAVLRDALAGLEELESGQQVMDFSPEARDIIAIESEQTVSSITLFRIREGKLLGKESFRSEQVSGEGEALQDFLIQYYSSFPEMPGQVLVSHPIETELVNEFFDRELDRKVSIGLPQTERDSALMRLAAGNARLDLEDQLRRADAVLPLKELQTALSLDTLPERIEGFDIAHLSGTHPVASMVSFLNGRPDKGSYRLFHVKTLEGAVDDYEAIREVVARRYGRLLNEERPLPELVLIDGGRGQVSAAVGVLRALGLEKTRVAGLAKKNEEVFLPDRKDPVIIPEGSPALQVLQRVRDEAHRFATGFNKRLRQKDVGSALLEGVEGIGPARSRRLLQHFGSLKAMAEAGEQALQESAGLTDAVAADLKRALESFIGGDSYGDA